MFGIKKFHNYLHGCKFIIESDHKPLFFFFSEKKGIPHMASTRIQRWALTLSAYQYTIHHKSGTEIGNANGLSRLPIPDYLPGEMINLLEHLLERSYDATDIKKFTNTNPVLSTERRCILSGSTVPEEEDFKPYKTRQHEP